MFRIFLLISVSYCVIIPWEEQIPTKKFEQKRQTLLKWSQKSGLTKNISETSLGYLAICTLAKNEPDIQEWVQYHLFKGVNKIYLFDNGSKPPLINSLQKFVDNGRVDYFYFQDSHFADDFEFQRNQAEKNQKPFQNNIIYVWAIHSCMQWFGHRHKFVAIIDVDEFLVLDNLTQTFPEYLKNFENFGGLKIYRQFFGSSGHEKRPNGTVLENYTKCTKKINTYKKQYNPKQITNMKFFAGLCGSHWCKTTKPVVNSQMVEETPENKKSGLYVRNFQGIRVNHYYYKSMEDIQLKWLRKFGKYKAYSESFQKTMFQWFDELDSVAQNDCLEGIELSKQCCSNLTS